MLKQLLIFSNCDNFEHWHRNAFVKSLAKKFSDNNHVETLFFLRPHFFLKRSAEKNLKDSIINLQVVRPFILLPMALCRKNALLNYFFHILPLKLQIFFLKKPIKSVLWFYKPEQIELIKHLGGMKVFEVYDNYAKDPSINTSRSSTYQKFFDQAISISSKVFITNEFLYKELCAKYQRYRNNLFYLPNAVDKTFLKHKSKKNITTKPVIGFVGNVSEFIEIDTFLQLAEFNKNWIIRIVGTVSDHVSVKFEALANKTPNIELIGSVPYCQLPSEIEKFTIGICPYKEWDFNQYRNPMKFYEYAALGVYSVVSGCELDQEQRALSRQANNKNFAIEVEASLKDVERFESGLISFASKNTWDDRAKTVYQHMSDE